jgi:ABC-type polysaccharide/polyol phosphate export permease
MWGVAILINLVCALVALVFFARYRHRIPYWI